MEEVSLFLNVCGMEDIVTYQMQMQIDGKELTDGRCDKIKDKLTEK